MGRPRKPAVIDVPLIQDLDLTLQDRDKQASHLRNDSYRMARLFGRSIFQSLRDENKTGLREMVVNFGIATDKVLGGVESSGLTLTVPASIIDKLMIAVQTKPCSTNPNAVILENPSQNVPSPVPAQAAELIHSQDESSHNQPYQT